MIQPTGASGQSIPETSVLCHCTAASVLFALILFCTKKKRRHAKRSFYSVPLIDQVICVFLSSRLKLGG